MKSSDRCYIPVLAGLGGTYCLVSVTGKTERGGFEPPKAFDLTRLPIVHLRPLGHLSKVLKQGKFNETSLFVQEGSSVTVNAFFRAIVFCRTFRAERGEGSAYLLPE